MSLYPASPLKAQGNQKNSIQQTNHPYAFEANLMEVMFNGESRVRMRNGTPTDLSTHALQGVDQVLSSLQWHEWQRLTDVPESTVDNWETNGEFRTGKDIYNLNNIYRLKIPEGYDVWKLAEQLEALPGIYSARPVPRPVALPTPGNYQNQQGYLNPAANNPSGVDAIYSWTRNGGTGTGVTICDIEYSWNYNHADITKALGSQINPNTITDPFNDNNHGTAVLGEMFADNNGWGTTGICYGSGLKTCGTYWNGNWNPSGAIAYAISSLAAGDIILMEQQWDYTGNGGYVPIEWYSNTAPGGQTNNPVYAAIVNAVANGISVVEAGGNGNYNTGTLAWMPNSGAIIVGAGGGFTTDNLKRIVPGTWGSSYGPRYDLQGWGENVFTTGYGTYYNSQGPNYYYRADFNGTSSASPVVAGALACVEGYYFANVSTTIPTPAYWRNLLVANGTAQVTPPTGNIGPRPDIKATILSLPIATMDFGDAPDGPYPTLMVSNGARHTGTGLSLGPLIDVELDGQPNGTATGDDINPVIADDEDGVVFTSLLTPGQLATVQVTANMPCLLDAWVDFNKINAWADPGEQVFQNVLLAGGINNLTFMVPANAMPLFTYARFRVSGQGGLMYFGAAQNGEVEDYQVFIQQPSTEFGDAPDPGYPTLLASNGARHNNTGPNIIMGVQKDFEPDGQPNIMANGDDLNNLADEDGVIFTTPLMLGQPASVNVLSNTPGALLQAWIDFNADGDWADAGEQIATNYVTMAGPNNIPFTVPLTGITGVSYARFRLSTILNLSYTGLAPNGEVEDYRVMILPAPPPEIDFGDAPDPLYPTLLASNGARHTIDQVTFLGSLIDGEPDGQPLPGAMGDDIANLPDEDGVTFMWPVAKGNPCKLKVKASVGNAMLNCWIDYNGNGSWADPNEHVFVDLNLLAGDNYLTFITPQGATPGPSYARFRFSHQPALSYDGLASDGEVEDYMVNINKFTDIKWQQLPDTLLPGLHVNETNTVADDWICDGSIVTDIHWWGNYEMLGTLEKRGAGINHFLVNIYSNSSCKPYSILKTYVVPFTLTLENYTGQKNNEGSRIYKYDYLLPLPFIQHKDTTYWLSVQAISNDLGDPPTWRWQEANRWLFPVHCGATQDFGTGWQTITWPFPPLIKYSDFAFQLTTMVLDTLYVQNENVTAGQSSCYDARLVLIVAGGGTTFTVQNGGQATMISGGKIDYLPGTTVFSGGYMHGYITTTGQYCSFFKSSTAVGATAELPGQEMTEVPVIKAGVKVFPNPTTGKFILEIPDKGETNVEIFGMFGKCVMREMVSGQNRYELSLGSMPAGVYILHLISGNKSETFKIIKQ